MVGREVGQDVLDGDILVLCLQLTPAPIHIVDDVDEGVIGGIMEDDNVKLGDVDHEGGDGGQDGPVDRPLHHLGPGAAGVEG